MKRAPSVYDDVTEKAWQAQVLELLQYRGYHCYHTHDSRRSEAGFPDVIALNPRTGDIVVLELKTERGRVTPEQLQWIAWWETCNVTARVLRPSEIDWLVERTRK